MKKYLKKYFLTDDYTSEDDTAIFIKDDETKEEEIESESESSTIADDEPCIEFIVEENEKKEKSIRLNFQFKLDNSKELIKIDVEISKNTYLEIADELIK